MSEELMDLIQQEFSECYTLDEVARLYCDIRMECEKQLGDTNIGIAKEMHRNGLLDEG